MEQFQNITPKNKEIFLQIGNLLVTYSFREAQISYFEKHNKDFDSFKEDESAFNNLFQEYTSILKENIDKKLLEKFTESELKEFYGDFTMNFKNYDIKSTWLSTIETLLTFTDYNNFKKTMMDYYERENKGKVAQKKPYKKLDVNPDFNTFHNYFLRPTSDFQQVLKGEKEDEIDTYTIQHNDTVQVSISKYIVKGVEVDTLVDSYFKTDFEKIKASMPYFKEMEEIQINGETKSNDVQNLYCVYEFPMMPRSDSLTRTEKSQYEDYQLIRYISIENEKYPVNQDLKRVEMYQQIYSRQIPGTKNTEVIDITFSERELSVPQMILGMIMAKTTKESMNFYFDELRNQQSKKDSTEL